MFTGGRVARGVFASITVFALVAAVDRIPSARGAAAMCSLAPFYPAPRWPETTILVGSTRADTVRAGPGTVEPSTHGGHWGSGRPREVYGQLVRVHEADGPGAAHLGGDSLLVIVPWDYDSMCEPAYWSRSAAWIPADLEGFYSVRLRSPESWGEHPVADAFHADLQPYPHAAFFKAGYRGTSALKERPSLTAREYFSLMSSMPTQAEAAADPGAVLEHLLAWEAANPVLSTHYPADQIIEMAKRRRR